MTSSQDTAKPTRKAVLLLRSGSLSGVVETVAVERACRAREFALNLKAEIYIVIGLTIQRVDDRNGVRISLPSVA